MSRQLTINSRFKVTENDWDHGTWTVHDHATGKRLATSVRTVGQLAELVETAPGDGDPEGQREDSEP